MVFKDGRLVARDGKMVVACRPKRKPRTANSVKMKPVSARSLKVPARSERIRVLEIVPRQILTKARIMKARVENGFAASDVHRDVLKLVVVERHHRSGSVGIGFVRGFGLKRGAIASSVAHDSHNIIAVGVEDEDLAVAVRAIEQQKGGFVVVDRGRVTARLPLPVAGLMTDQPARTVAREYERVQSAAHWLGTKVEDPLLQLSFLALPVIPALKLTDRGLVDVHAFRHVDLFV